MITTSWAAGDGGKHAEGGLHDCLRLRVVGGKGMCVAWNLRLCALGGEGVELSGKGGELGGDGCVWHGASGCAWWVGKGRGGGGMGER